MKIYRHIPKAMAVSLLASSLLCTAPCKAEANSFIPTQLQGFIPSDLIPDISSLLGEVTQLIISIPSGQFLQSQLTNLLGQYLPEVQNFIAQSIGSLGLPDPHKAQSDVIAAIKGVFNISGLNQTISSQGLVTSAITSAFSQNVLGLDGQTRLKKTLEDVMSSAQKVAQLSANSISISQANMTTAETALSTAFDSSSLADTALSTATEVNSLAEVAQSSVSSQDVLKVIAQQNGQNSSILSNIAAQFGNNASQLGNVATQIGGLSNQNSQVSDQNTQTTGIQVQQLQQQVQQTQQGAASLLNLDQINDSLKGDRQERILDFQALIQQRQSFTFLR